MIKTIDRKRFCAEVEETRMKSEGYVDAIIVVCEKYDIDASDTAGILNPIIKKKLEVECVNKGLVDGIKVNSLEDL